LLIIRPIQNLVILVVFILFYLHIIFLLIIFARKMLSMKVTVIRKKKDGGETFTTIELSELIDRMKVDKDGLISRFRDAADNLERAENWEHYYRLCEVCPGAELTKTGKYRVCNGVSIVKVQQLNNVLEAERIKQQAQLFPQTLCAFVGADGHSAVVWTLATLPDGSLPKDEHLAELFNAQAYVTSVLNYTPTFDYPITIEAASLGQKCLMTYDEHPYFNSHVTPFIIEQPSETSVASIISSKTTENRLERLKPKPETYITFSHLYYNVCRRLNESLPSEKRNSDDLSKVERIAEACLNAGLPEEEVVYRLINRFFKEDENVIRTAVAAIYAEAKDTILRGVMTKHQIVAYKLREFFERRYDIRFNEVLQMTEYRPRHSFQFLFKELGRRELNTIHHEACIEGIDPTFGEIDEYAHSNYIPKFNPIEEYINQLPKWDGKDRFAELAAMVPTDNANWERLFSRWFLSMVAHWMHSDTSHANATAPILIGAQGFRKSTFWRLLLPPELQDYFTDSIDFRSNIEAERSLSRFLLINIDEFDQLSEKQFAFVKHLFQKPSTNIRRMYSETIGTQRRYASFVGTSNHHEILRDPTGNRRYLCVEVKDRIRTEQPINYAQLYAQAKHLILHGERYWINDEDEAMIRESNKVFELESPLEQLIYSAFVIPQQDEEGEWMTAVDIMAVLQTLPAFNRKTDNNLYKLGRVLTKLQLKKKRMSMGSVYWIKRLRRG